MALPPGLTADAAQQRLERYGPNALPEHAAPSAAGRFFRQFHSPLMYLLLGALVLDAALWLRSRDGVPAEAAAIGIILLLNAGLGAWREGRAERTLRELRRLAVPQVWALRDGRFTLVPASTIVVGDIVRIDPGDRAPADGLVRSGGRPMFDESILTGESFPVEKEGNHRVLAGTLLVRGPAVLEITETGPASALGRLASLLQSIPAEPTPLERRLTVFGRRIAQWVVVLAVGMVLFGVMVGRQPFSDVLTLAVALAVAAVPEGLAAVLSLTLAMGVDRMARRRAVIRRLAAVEALGSVTVIVTDKTGTLTENRLDVAYAELADEERGVRVMAIANEADPGSEAGDPMEVALLRHLADAGVDVGRSRASFTRESHQAFDPRVRYMRVSGRENGRLVTYVKGAPEAVLERCRLSPDERRRVVAAVERSAAQGYRLIALAWGDGEGDAGLHWAGLVALVDPPRPEVADAVRRSQEAGVRVVMVTGDHRETAVTVARMVGIPEGRVLIGAELDEIPAGERPGILRQTMVVARATPEHKLLIVDALKAGGEIVAVTGDGVNDAPALKRADVGIAMGKRGSAVSREAADIILLDDNFASLVAAIEEGRGIYQNIQKFVRFLFSTNLSEVLVVIIGILVAAVAARGEGIGFLLPLTAAQLLWINLVTDGLPALALAVDRNPGVMAHPPRDPATPLLDRRSLRYILTTGVVIGSGALGLAAYGFVGHRLSGPELRTAVFFFLAWSQLACAYPARRIDHSPPPNRWLHAAVLVGALLQGALFASPVTVAALGLEPLPASMWIAVGVAVAAALAMAHTGARRLGSAPPLAS
jgi:Ca2+-transporting ATPase